MSNVVSALDHAIFAGFAEVKEIGLQGMITLRGDLAAPAMKKAIKAATGCDVPTQRAVLHNADKGVAWMSPDELLVLVPYEDADKTVAILTKSFGKAHFLAENVSDARAVFQIKGPNAAEVLAKVCPVDLSPAAFKPGMIRRSRLAQIAAAFWMVDADTFQLVCFRSVADYAFGVLTTCAESGTEVGYLR